MNIRLALAAIILVTTGTAYAEAPKANGVYMGLTAGLSLFDDDGAIGFYDDTDTTVEIYLGYKFFKNLSIEGRYAELGSFSDGIDTLEITATSFRVVGIIPFRSSGWEMFGHLGYADVSQKVPGLYSSSDSGGEAGIGVRWHINQSIALAAQIDAVAWQNSDIGSQYDLAVGTQKLSFQINF